MKRKLVILLVLFGLSAATYYFRKPIASWVKAGSSSEPAMAAGQHPGHGAAPVPQPSERKVLYWVDPMHPAYKSDKPGKAPDCGMDLVPVYAEEGPEAESMPEGAVKISPVKLQKIGVQYGELSYERITRTIRTVGRVAYDETKIARIHTKIDGWIERVYLDFVGKLMEKDQPLISIYSPELVSTQQELLIANKAKDYLGDSPVKEVASGAVSLYESTRDRLRLWDISEEQVREIEERGMPQKTLTPYAPVLGYVISRNAFERQRVTPDTELYAIADLSTIWVLADIYEYEVPLIRLGQTAKMTLSYFPGKTYTGKLTYIYPQLENMTRTLKVRLEFPNPDIELKPDMYANVELQIDYGRQLSVPAEAVLDAGDEQVVFVAHDGGYFEPRQVEVGGKVGGRYIILSGLKPGERIVTSGNFLIDSESRLKTAMAGMAHAEGTAVARPLEASKRGRAHLPPSKSRASRPTIRNTSSRCPRRHLIDPNRRISTEGDGSDGLRGHNRIGRSQNMSRKKAATIGTGILLVAVVGIGGYWLLRRTASDVCRVCQRGIHTEARAVIEADGRPESVCCIRCALTLARQQGEAVRLVKVTDYFSWQPLRPESAFYVEGSRVVLCEKHEPFLNHTKQPHDRVFDRCEPSVYAFACQEHA